jgi:hypothetical protein
MAGKSVTIQYRRLQDVADVFAQTTLEAQLRTAISLEVNRVRIRDRLAHRIWTRDPAGQDNLFANTLYDSGTYLFGDIVHFSRGHLQALFDAGLTDNPTVPVRQLPAPERMEYVHSIMFWLVIGNHVLIIQSQSLRTEIAEQYFTWLLTERTRTMTAPAHVLLASRFDPAAVGGAPTDIKEIVIGGVAPVPQAHEVGAPRIVELDHQEDLTARRGTGFEQARGVLAALLNSDAQADAFLRNVPAEAEFSVVVHIGYKTRKRHISRAPLAALEAGLRNMAHGELRVAGRGADRLATGDVRLHQTAMIEADGSLLQPDDVREKMLAVYRSFVELGKIAA